MLTSKETFQTYYIPSKSHYHSFYILGVTAYEIVQWCWERMVEISVEMNGLASFQWVYYNILGSFVQLAQELKSHFKGVFH